MTDHERNGRTLRGSMTALVTPFRDGEVDDDALRNLVDRQIEAGTDWLVVLGTTAESPTLTDAERDRILEVVLERAAGRCPVMAGTGSNDTARAVAWSRRAAEAGADALLVVAPYYNRPPAEGMFRHFAAVAEAVSVPIVLYDVPKRTGTRIDVEVIARLRERFSHVLGIKDATGWVENVSAIRQACDIAVLSGDDAITWPMLCVGAVGVISVLGNLAPDLMKALVTAGEENDMERGRTLHRRVFDLATGLGRLGPNPIPIKTALALRGWVREEFRLPLCPLDETGREAIRDLLRRHELLEGTRG